MKLATIGTGWITTAFIKAAKETGKMSLAAVYSRSLDSARKYAEENQAEAYFDNLEEMAQCPDIDIVYIASPNSLHYEQVMLFLRNKKHVICEKPIFSNMEEFKEACKTAEENNVFLFEAIRSLHNPNLKKLKENLSKTGKIRSAFFQYQQYSSRYDAFLAGEEPNVFSLAYSGGALTDLGVYPLFAAAALFGKPEKAHYYPVLLRNGVDGGGTLVLDYGTFVCTILTSKMVQSHLPCEIAGEEGSIVFSPVSTFTEMDFIDRRSNQRTSIPVEQHEQDMVYEVEEFVRIIEENDQEASRQLHEISASVLTITEDVRRQNGILFDVEKP